MDFKTDTKEKFQVIRVQNMHFSAKMAGELRRLLCQIREGENPHVIVDVSAVGQMDREALTQLCDLAAEHRNLNHSFVLCSPSPSLLHQIREAEAEEILNLTPTESEAWDIVQMEEIERELLGGDESSSGI